MISLKDLLDIISQNVIVNIFHAVDHRAIGENEWNQEWKVILIRAPRRKQIDIEVI